ncbi:hypothetical protein [Flavobacterium subsaxonicum]|uniref:Uncharacterized protein n=1 Tax=Flavobacterium subsaxonicum WB 4.1-42 = DSM 21790 TaxID=1121898 RepID=A0A0A2MIY1_9FLAO|nr:hypothetical protein [Flavobacterium subsaxonicum]KGO92234.1 hypothetical protein Q766_13835 [Flavobacterium subsaxonicum WB 4.1-42 = DSM 21790]
MIFTPPQNTDLLLSEAQKEKLYSQLVAQLNKDFALANESVDFAEDITPITLKLSVQDKIYRLIQHKFAEYLNLLYIIDVPEKEIKRLDGSDIAELAEQVAFLVLKREWQKVWFRNKY